MYFKTTYDQNFDDLYMHLKAKYPDKLFDLDGIGKQMDMSEFSRNFFSAKVTSDASIDANANVDDTSVITYNIELPKPFFRLNSYYILWKELKRLYSLEVANTIIEMQLTGDIYIHDFHGVAAGQVYCFNYSSYDILTKGLPMIKKVKSIPPKHLHAFKSQLEQFVIIASNSTLGATGLADLLVILSYFAKNILSTKSDAHYKFQTEEDCWTYIKEMLISFIYSVNFSLRGNQCVTEDTEVLTPMGFKRYNELKVGDDIYTWDKGRLNIQKVEKVNIYEYDGIMHQYSGRDILQTVTPNHRVLHKKNGSKEYILSESSTIFDRLTPTTIPVSMIFDDRPDYEISDDLLKLAVFILTDGNIKKSDGRSDRISIFKSPMRWGNEELKGILNSLGLEYSLVNKPNGFDNGGSLNHYILNVENSSEILNVLNHTKSELPSWMFNLSKRQANIVIDLWAKLDGNTDTKNYNKKKLQCDNQKIADQLQHICFLSGKGSKIINRVIGENKKPTIYLIPYNRTNKDANKKEEVQYSGKVWCPTTKDGIVVFRKNGGIFISGNSPFTNLSVYDKYFLEKLCGDYLFPDGSSPDVDVVNKLQEIYLDIINAELERTPLTYPITTACFSVDNENNIQDEKFLDLISEKNKKYGFINIYCGKTSTLSSCCFDKNQKTLTKSSAGINYMSFKDIYESNYEKFKRNFTVFHNGSWAKGKIVKAKTEDNLFKITTANKKDFIVTKDHLHPTIDGNKRTCDLTTDDYLLFNGLALDTFPEADENLSYEDGYVVGMYLGDGSTEQKETAYSPTVHFSLNKEKYLSGIDFLRKSFQKLDDEKEIKLGKEYNNVFPIHITSKKIYSFIKKWVFGDYAQDKELNLNCLLQSREFRQGILDGYYVTDGGNSNRIYTSSEKLVGQIECLLTSLGLNSIIDFSDRRDESVIIRGKSFKRNHIIYCIRWYSPKNKRTMEDVFKIKNNSTYFKIIKIVPLEKTEDYVYCFEMENEEEPYFTLPNGLITHNCRLRSESDNEYFNSFGSGSSKIGSLGVCSINLPRLAIKSKPDKDAFKQDLLSLVNVCSKINNAKRKVIEKRIKNGNEPLYTYEFMDLSRQYSTVGLNGINECIELMGENILEENGQNFLIDILDAINLENKKLEKQYNAPHNVEQVPGENMSIKLAEKDKLMGYQNRYNIYSNQFIPLTTNADLLDRIFLQGLFDKHFTGGAICHINVESRIDDAEKIKQLIKETAKQGVIYHAINYNLQECEEGHMTVGKKEICSICGTKIINDYSRVVGFLTNTKNWAKVRRDEDYPNRVWYKDI